MNIGPHIQTAFRQGKEAARQNLGPGILLWVIGLILVLLYYFLPPVTSALNQLGVVKMRWSPWFAMASTAFFGSVVPWLIQLIFSPVDQRTPIRHLPWLMLFWAFSGFLVDLFYRLQAKIFGDTADFVTVATKTFVDQFIYSPLIAVPLMTAGYLVIGKDFRFSEIKAALQRKPFLERAIPVFLGNLTVWLPSIAIIYLFPVALQLPLANLVLGFWCLILTFFSDNSESP